jgi:hypothetical protein
VWFYLRRCANALVQKAALAARPVVRTCPGQAERFDRHRESTPALSLVSADMGWGQDSIVATRR